MAKQHPYVDPAANMLGMRVGPKAMRLQGRKNPQRWAFINRKSLLWLLICMTFLMASGGYRRTAAQAQAGPNATFEWAVQTRFGVDQQNNYSRNEDPTPDGFPDYLVGETLVCGGSEGCYDPYIFPSSWRVTLRASHESNSYRWAIDGLVVPEASGLITYDFTAQGAHEVTLTVQDQNGQTASSTQSIFLRDLLIVSVGDSTASGEGNPHVHQEFGFGGFVTKGPTWQDSETTGGERFSRCHRSMYAGPAMAAAEIGKSFPHTSVTFIHLACSGAKIAEVLLLPFDGKDRKIHPDGPSVPAQFPELAKLICPPSGNCDTATRKRPIDALLLAIGGNDIGFAEIAIECVRPNFNIPFPGPTCNNISKVVNTARDLLEALPPKFDFLAKSISDGITIENIRYLDGLPVKDVFITEYADPTHGSDGQFCSPPTPRFGVQEISTTLPDGTVVVTQFRDDVLSGLDYVETKWAYENILDPAIEQTSLGPPTLNAAIRMAVDRINSGNIPGGRPRQTWHYIGGIAEQFKTHGFCAGYGDTDTSAWFRTGTESVIIQGPNYFNAVTEQFTEGTLHPNHHGHLVLKTGIVNALAATVDVTPPSVTCDRADAQWHANDVLLNCTAVDGPPQGPAPRGISGFDDSVAVTFALSTNVASGVETANASTSSHEICDQAGNCVMAGPVRGIRVDKRSPTFEALQNLAEEATGAFGAVVNYTATANDGGSGNVSVLCDPSPGSTFPIGVSTVACSAFDAAGNTATESFAVTVVDTTAPTLTLPTGIIVDATAVDGTVVEFNPVALDVVDGARPTVCSPLSGTTFAAGVTTVNCMAMDSHANKVTGNFRVTVLTPAQIVAALMTAEGSSGRNDNSLQNALRSIDRGIINAACGQLQSFVNHTQAQAGKGLTRAAAAALVASATHARGGLGCR